jgi:hypothetical protein
MLDDRGHLRDSDHLPFEGRRTIAMLYTVDQDDNQQPEEDLLEALRNTVRTPATAKDKWQVIVMTRTSKKIQTILGAKFGPDEGKKAIIVRALYGLKSAGASFGHHLADCMRTLGYTRCKADTDLWYKPSIRPDDKFEYYDYVLLFVDDCLSISHDAAAALQEIDAYFPMKPGSIGDPDIYLGAISYDQWKWIMESMHGA